MAEIINPQYDCDLCKDCRYRLSYVDTHNSTVYICKARVIDNSGGCGFKKHLLPDIIREHYKDFKSVEELGIEYNKLKCKEERREKFVDYYADTLRILNRNKELFSIDERNSIADNLIEGMLFSIECNTVGALLREIKSTTEYEDF